MFYDPQTSASKGAPLMGFRNAFLLAASIAFAVPQAQAQDLAYPKAFRTQQLATNGTTLHVRVGGSGPAVVLLHGYGETGDMWAPLAADLAARPHRHRARPARHGPLRQARPAATTRRLRPATSPACSMR